MQVFGHNRSPFELVLGLVVWAQLIKRYTKKYLFEPLTGF